MANQNGKAKEQNTYEAIVIGSGISGGWAAKELAEGGIKTLILERGRDVKHPAYPTATKDPWEFPRGDRVPDAEIEKHYAKQNRTGYTIRESLKHWWVKDDENPYTEVKRFDWIRGYHVGGRSIMWGRQSYRLSDLDFEANAKEGVAVDWPIRYADVKKWYDYVERFVGVSGQKEGLPQLPDGEFLPPMDMNCVEKHVRDVMKDKFGRVMTIGRTAHLTQEHLGRGKCQFRNLCMRGCPFSGYFSSVSATLPAAYKTGNATLRPNSIVTEILYDEDSKKAKGVRIQDAETGEVQEFYAKIIFCCASALGSTWILAHSKSDRFPNGLGNDSGELGHNVMDHHFQIGAQGTMEGMEDMYYYGRRPNGIYVPRFVNLGDSNTKRDYLRGFGYQGGGSRGAGHRVAEESIFGEELKTASSQPGPWTMRLHGFGECLPYHENKVTMNYDVLDKHGLPTWTMDAEFKENEMKMREDMKSQAMEMLEAAGLKDVQPFENGSYPGLGIHEMGTARMGRDPKTSVLNKWNQIHACKNVFVTDGACMTSAGCQNPSLTYMALTARAANYAIEELKKGNL